MRSFLLLILFIAAINTHGQIITTIAGDGFGGYSGDGGPASVARLNTPYGIFADASGNIYIPDGGNRCIRKISSSGVITTVAGTGILGHTGDGGPATAAQMHEPTCVCLDGAGNMYIADQYNNCIRKVNAAGIISTFAGTTVGGYSGDGGPATAAKLNYPYSVIADATGNVYIADRLNNRIRKVDLSGTITTVVGTGTTGYTGDGGPATAATLFQPVSLCLSPGGDMYVTDWGNKRVRKINPAGIISTFAGNGTPTFVEGVAAVSSGLDYPYGVSIDCGGNVYIADFTNYRVVRVNTSGIVNSIAGNGTFGYSGDGGAATAAQLYYPIALSLDAAGDMLVSDQGNNVIRKITNPGAGGIISGPNNVCVGGTATLTSSLAGGSWSTTTGRVSITSGGVYTGLTVGVDTIEYTGCSSVSRYPVTVNTTPTIAAISGPDTVCAGSTITLTDPTSGGTWTSGATATATIGATGVVTGVAGGTATITYRVTTSCGTASAYKTVTVSPLPTVSPITGPTFICNDTGITLANATPGGTWSSINTLIAAVNSVGHVNGFTTGVDTIMYTVTNGCGTASASYTVTVMTLPAVSPVSGPSSVCEDSSITMTDTTSGGIWSVSSGAIATISTTGIVTGVTAGTVTISFSKTNLCGTASMTAIVSVVDCDTILTTKCVNIPQKFVVSPNPANTTFTISGVAGADDHEILLELRDMPGRMVYHTQLKIKNGSISESVTVPEDIQSGIYILSLHNSTGRHSQPLVIQR